MREPFSLRLAKKEKNLWNWHLAWFYMYLLIDTRENALAAMPDRQVPKRERLAILDKLLIF